MKHAARRTTQQLLNGTRFVCRAEGNGFIVLNKHGQWTPVLEFGHAYEANLATHLARWRHGYTRESLPLTHISAPAPPAL